MPTHQTTIDLLGLPVPVTVTWYLDGSDPEIEAVHSDRTGDLTDLVLNSVLGCTYRQDRLADLRQHWSGGSRDPLRDVLFSQTRVMHAIGDPRTPPWAVVDSLYGPRWRVASVPTVPVLAAVDTVADRIVEEIRQTEAFAECGGDDDDVDDFWEHPLPPR